ncbi:hypothetical protein OAV22_02060 [Flavobacteriaceae bacterium]|nr:hypothetical protein [Flavobacteriaceae bacterium]
MKLRNIRNVGRFKNPKTGREVNVKTGNWASRGTDHYFYLYRGKRILIADIDFHHRWKNPPKQTNRQELIGQLRRALGELERPNNDDPVEFEILDLEDFCFEQSFLNEVNR